MTQEIIDCDVVIQAGHENTPDDRTGGEGPLGREIDWTPIVANEAVRLLKEAGVKAVKETVLSSSRDRNIAASSRCSFISMTRSRRGRVR
jgi:hypothetical protein